MSNEPLTDESPMPFGEHKDKKMEKVPPSYLLWLWDEGGVWNQPHRNIHKYIKGCFSALLMDCPDYEPKHRP